MKLKMNLITLTIYLSLFSILNSKLLVPCLPVQDCTYLNLPSIQCSVHGKCFYDLFSYLTSTSSRKKFIDCLCDEGYSSESENAEVRCCYQQKSQSYAFFLEIIGFGIGHFYAGKRIYAIIKMSVEICLLIVCFVLHCCVKQNKTEKNILHKYETINNQIYMDDNNIEQNEHVHIRDVICNIIIMLNFIIIAIWQIVDAINYGLNNYNDENGQELKRW